MSKIKLTGHGSGSGTLTIQAPDTDSARTITLPDASGTLLNSDGSAASLTAIPAANITGTLPAIDGSNLTGISTGLSSKVVSFTHDASSTSNQAITGVGFQPTCILFFMSKGYVTGWGSIGWVDSGKTGNSYADTHNRTADTFTKGAKNTASILAMDADTVYTEGNVDTYDADGFTLTWNKSSTPTGTIYIDALCFK